MSRLSTKRASLIETPYARILWRQLGAKLVLCAAILLALVTFQPPPVAAHGGGVVRLSAAPAGPYILTVWVSPEVIRAGRPMHVSVSVEMENRPQLDAEVLVQVVPEGGTAAAQTAAATSDQSANKLLYEADLTIATPGSYSVEILVNGPAGHGQGTFEIDVIPASDINWLLIGAPILLAGAVLILFRRRRQGAAVQIKP